MLRPNYSPKRLPPPPARYRLPSPWRQDPSALKKFRDPCIVIDDALLISCQQGIVADAPMTVWFCADPALTVLMKSAWRNFQHFTQL
jgi:hypothetical protein